MSAATNPTRSTQARQGVLHASARTVAHRSGMAIVLALVVAAIAVVFGLALAGARDATVATSENLARAAAARTAAAGGIDIARGLLNDPLLLEHSLGNTDGVLFDSLPIGDTRVRAEIRDLETGLPAGRGARAVEILVAGDRGGVVQTARAIGRIERPEDAARADLDCSEFAILTKGPLVVDNGAHIALWRASPLSVLAEPVRIGAASGETSFVAIDPRASVHGCVRLRCASFAPDADADDELLADKLCQIPAAIHIPAPPLPARDARRGDDDEDQDGQGEESVGDAGQDDDDAGLDDPEAGAEVVREALFDGLIGSDAILAADARVPARSVATFRGPRTFEIGGNLHIERGARVVFEGPTVLVVRGNAVFDACELEIAPEGSLSVIVFGDVTFDGAYAGGMRSDPGEGCDASGAAAYDGGAARMTVFVHGEQRVLLVDGSVLKGQVYAPDARIDVESRSAVYGRLLGARVTLHEGVALFYDPALDSRRGWTNRWSGIWVADGEIDGAVRGVERLDAESLQEFANASGIVPDASSVAEAAVALAPGAGGGPGHANSAVAEGDEADADARGDRGRRRAQRAVERLRELIGRGVIEGSRFVSLGFDTPESEAER